MKLLSMMAVLLVFSLQAFASIVPKNDLYIPVGAKFAGGLTEEEFNNVIEKVGNIYIPMASNLGGTLKIARKWDDGTVNANASRSGSTWNVNMYGGLARHKTITQDGFALVLCHEIGHHMGGAPKVSGFLGFNRWASNEGQADYFATLKCLRQVFLNDNNEEIVTKLKVPEHLIKSCSQAWADKTDNAICVRSGMAGSSVAALFASLRNAPEAQFNTPDSAQVSKTSDAHPAHQCRLDTFFQGALCEKAVSEEVSQKEEVKGTCHGSTGQTVGLRPRCWFRPSVN